MIVTELKGGMGNQMFQYALGRHLSIKHNTDLFLDTNFLLNRTLRNNFVYRDYNLNIFNIQKKFAPPPISRTYGSSRSLLTRAFQKIIKPFPLKYISEKDFIFNHELLDASDDLYISGYWQSEKYFKDIQTIIRSDFTFKDLHGIAIQTLAEKIDNSNAVCLHVRRGDFVNNPSHGTLDMKYYSKAINYLKQLAGDIKIYVFSDEIEWCEQYIKFEIETYYVTNQLAGQDTKDHFELMTRCKHFVIPNSSFGWWAAWLCNNPNKIVVAPMVWFPDNKWDARDIVPESWVKM